MRKRGAYTYAMNVLFALLFLSCTLLLLFLSPESFLPALLDGASKGATVCVSLIATYSVWLGLMRLWEDCGISRMVSKLLKPIAKRIFKTEDEEALTAISMNLSVNMLGISGAATPYGIQAANLLDKTKNAEYSSAMLFVLNATSLQIFPSSMIAVRVAMHSSNPTDIIIPTLLTTLFSTLLGGFLTWLFLRPKQEQTPSFFAQNSLKKAKTTGAGT